LFLAACEVARFPSPVVAPLLFLDCDFFLDSAASGYKVRSAAENPSPALS